MRHYITKKTEKLRYKTASIILKHLTPVLFNKIDFNTFINHKVFRLKTDNIHITVRPAIIFIKERFVGKLIKGAEIGVQRGRNAESILRELNIEKLYLIDTWYNYKEIYGVWSLENYACVLRKFRNDKRVRIMRNYSKNAVNFIENNSLDFVYIDANHKYKYVYQDIMLWFKKVKKGGIIAGHDALLNDGNFCDVLEAVKDFCYKNKINFHIKLPDWYFIKTNNKTHQNQNRGVKS